MQLKKTKTSILRNIFIVFNFIVIVKTEKSSPNQTVQDSHFKQKSFICNTERNFLKRVLEFPYK